MSYSCRWPGTPHSSMNMHKHAHKHKNATYLQMSANAQNIDSAECKQVWCNYAWMWTGVNVSEQEWTYVNRCERIWTGVNVCETAAHKHDKHDANGCKWVWGAVRCAPLFLFFFYFFIFSFFCSLFSIYYGWPGTPWNSMHTHEHECTQSTEHNTTPSSMNTCYPRWHKLVPCEHKHATWPQTNMNGYKQV